MRFVVLKNDLNMKPFSHARGKRFQLDSSTSVAQQKMHLLEAIKELGAVVPIDETIKKEDYKALCAREDTIVVTVHHPLPYAQVPRRLLLHSLGDFMLVNVYFDPEHFAANTVNLMTSKLQAQRIKDHLGEASPGLGVFTPQLKTDIFYPPGKTEKAAARNKMRLRAGTKHIVYAGRWLSNKGICQIIRALNLWTVENVKITFAGNFEPGFTISQNGANHHTFADYFQGEVLSHNRVKIDMLKAHGPHALRELLWSADLFVYPSVHEDENFGMVPREAVLCGVPVVVTDFCGLGQLGSGVGGLLPTYPTLAGPRYSLKQLRDLIAGGLNTGKTQLNKNIRFVSDECDPTKAMADLKRAVKTLVHQPLGKDIPKPKAARRQLLADLMRYADPGILQALIEKNRPLPGGLLADGTGFHNKEFAYHKLLSTIQGFYTTTSRPPSVKSGDTLRGFYRLGLWPQEKMLVEFGFPGPRLRRYADRDWQELTACARVGSGTDLVFCPRSDKQLFLTRELIELGYIVPDIW